MEKWKLALKQFLSDYEENDDVIGAILCGSYANDTYNDNSDINVILVLNDDLNYEEKGISYIQSFIISYDKITISKIEEYFKQNYDSKKLVMVNMIAYGKIIYDLDEKLKHLQALALDYMDKELDTETSYNTLLNNYHIWHNLNELKQLLIEDNIDFNCVYYNLLSYIYESYCNYLAIPIYPKEKLYKILTDEIYRQKYHAFKLPDKDFICFYTKCYNEVRKSEMYKNIYDLVMYFYDKQGSFNIRTFNIRRDF